ncbi:RNA polymerase sigma-70 factor, ECF subfamily [Chitinophaga rupis]|uniref:RNA polymerase sigma-70 factor, ECF subfamily n=1 Tax=Chitinophaga rupis TaxID=573321 RepID=A0A1H7PA25_9BACT|nr:sigma-70 family RNA polymerase sigma factor [Chitinophaga rupis]SEL32105.1 RNA polymerase sigma-70 factor, ECF subfamily [Chitinophaga rupis]
MSAEEAPLAEEQVLLKKVSAGDEAAFTLLFNQYYPLLSTHVFRITRSLPETEEIVQDVFFKIWMTRESLGNIAAFRPYLWVMAKNRALNALQKTARERSNRTAYLQEYTETEKEDDLHTLHSLIDEAIHHLPPQQKKVYLLSRRQRLRQAEIAAQTGLTVPTVKKYMQLAVAAISDYIKERHPLITIPLLLLRKFL